ncbi:hypothetical protein ACK3YQ_07405 [Aeromonas caviae]|uniref:hypothetical protein n=1 Tax=Aeromonas caviae TaxID=648 RepID=UPI002B4AAD5D|nr:hypothetical protein [Aeromonas caviae]
MSQQFQMSRIQHIEFSKEEAQKINPALEFTEFSVNKFIRKATLAKAKKVIQDQKGGDK